MEPDYIITETGLPNILLGQSKVIGKKFGVTQVRKFQHKKKEDDSLMNMKNIKNCQNEKLKNAMKKEQTSGEQRESLEKFR